MRTKPAKIIVVKELLFSDQKNCKGLMSYPPCDLHRTGWRFVQISCERLQFLHRRDQNIFSGTAGGNGLIVLRAHAEKNHCFGSASLYYHCQIGVIRGYKSLNSSVTYAVKQLQT